MQRKSVHGVREGRELPRTDVAGEVEHAAAALLASEKVFVAVEDHHSLDILSCVFREMREFRGQPAQVAHHRADHILPPSVAPFRESEAQIEFGGTAQLREHRVHR